VHGNYAVEREMDAECERMGGGECDVSAWELCSRERDGCGV
jgi:hypothetical protein